MTQRYIHDVSANISGIAQTVEGCISDLSDLEKMDQKSGKAAGKEGDMDDYQKKMGDVDELTVKMKTLEVGNNIRQDIVRDFLNSSDDDPEDWIDAFARAETNGCISDLSDLEKMDQKSGEAAGKEGGMGEKIKGIGLEGSTSMKTNAGEDAEEWIDAFASILLHTNESISDLSTGISGIPQGTELGSVLFTLHISEIAKPRCQICKTEFKGEKSSSIHQKMDDWEIANRTFECENCKLFFYTYCNDDLTFCKLNGK